MRAVSMVAVLGVWLVGCASEGKPCVSHTDCGAGLQCTEFFLCQPPQPEGMDLCVDARQGLGLHPVRVTDGRFKGDVGPFRAFNHGACDLAAFNDGNALTVNTVVPSPRGPAMTIFQLQDGLTRPDLYPGRTVTFTAGEGVVHGCAEWNRSNWSFDLPSDSVTVTVRDAADGRAWIYDYTAHFPGGLDPVYGAYGAHEIRGSFSVERPD
ncbi:MAG: hypothetical protein HY904_19890 [Deltaproteobacteria bacterium]|nr:hypothetical protein [Deltaproteobacteria bacterium]